MASLLRNYGHFRLGKIPKVFLVPDPLPSSFSHPQIGKSTWNVLSVCPPPPPAEFQGVNGAKEEKTNPLRFGDHTKPPGGGGGGKTEAGENAETFMGALRLLGMCPPALRLSEAPVACIGTSPQGAPCLPSAERNVLDETCLLGGQLI